MTMAVSKLVLPLALIAVGLGWLLTTMNIIPDVNWVWIIALAACGILIPAVAGIDKVTLVLGLFLLAASVFSILRQTERLSIDHELPLLVILLGVLILIVQLTPVPMPRWLTESKQGAE